MQHSAYLQVALELATLSYIVWDDVGIGILLAELDCMIMAKMVIMTITIIYLKNYYTI